MPAYMIVTAHVKDRARAIADDATPTAALIARHGGHYIVRAPGAELLEGSFGAGASVVVSQFPDRATLDAFWNDPEYQPLKIARQPHADVNILVVEAP